METKKAARKYLEAGFSIIPTTANKIPAIGNWMKYQKLPMTSVEFENLFHEEHNIGLLTGGAQRIVCLDADMKYDLSGDLWLRFKTAVPNSILKKVMCQTTQNKGFHLVFRAPASRLVGNEKLAARPTTAYEKHITYMEAFNNPDTMEVAAKMAVNDTSRILFETRSGSAGSCGGYFLIYPSIGYTHLGGKIGELSEDEYDIIMAAARSFNQVRDFEKPLEKHEYTQNWEVNPFDHYNETGDILSVLESNGWVALPQQGKDIRLKRPGQTFAKHSAILDTRKSIFNCFSTSTRFDVNKGYSAASVFIMLECENDSSLGYKKLIEMGYGIPI